MHTGSALAESTVTTSRAVEAHSFEPERNSSVPVAPCHRKKQNELCQNYEVHICIDLTLIFFN